MNLLHVLITVLISSLTLKIIVYVRWNRFLYIYFLNRYILQFYKKIKLCALPLLGPFHSCQARLDPVHHVITKQHEGELSEI